MYSTVYHIGLTLYAKQKVFEPTQSITVLQQNSRIFTHTVRMKPQTQKASHQQGIQFS